MSSVSAPKPVGRCSPCSVITGLLSIPYTLIASCFSCCCNSSKRGSRDPTEIDSIVKMVIGKHREAIKVNKAKISELREENNQLTQTVASLKELLQLDPKEQKQHPLYQNLIEPALKIEREVRQTLAARYSIPGIERDGHYSHPGFSMTTPSGAPLRKPVSSNLRFRPSSASQAPKAFTAQDAAREIEENYNRVRFGGGNIEVANWNHEVTDKGVRFGEMQFIELLKGYAKDSHGEIIQALSPQMQAQISHLLLILQQAAQSAQSAES